MYLDDGKASGIMLTEKQIATITQNKLGQQEYMKQQSKNHFE